MKIEDSLKTSSGVRETGAKEEKHRVPGQERANFTNQLKRVEEENYRERLRSLAERIFEQGEKLGKKADLKEFKVYKKLISNFLDEAVANSFKFSKKNFLDRRGRHRIYAVIKRIDEELEELAKDVLAKEKDNIKILKRLDDIRGLILDIVL